MAPTLDWQHWTLVLLPTVKIATQIPTPSLPPSTTLILIHPDPDPSVTSICVLRGISIVHQAPLPDPPESIAGRSQPSRFCRNPNSQSPNNQNIQRQFSEQTKSSIPSSRSISSATISNQQQRRDISDHSDHGSTCYHSTVQTQLPSTRNNLIQSSDIDHTAYLAARVDDFFTAFMKSQANMECIVTQQQEMMSTFLTFDRELQIKQDHLMQKQLSVLQEIATSTKKSRVPASHFQPSPIDGISIASTTQSNQSTTQEIPSHPPPTQQNLQQSSDDASITSQLSAAQGYQDIKLHIEKFDEDWLTTDPALADSWFTNVIAELATKSYFHPLLTTDKSSINYDDPVTGPNSTLFSVLMQKLTIAFRTMCINCKATTGTAVL